MTDTFTASNGIEVTMDPDREGKVYLVGRRARGDEGQYLDTHATGGPEGIVALREFFQHERDEALGRWRWPENKAVVVYPEQEGLHWVVREDTGEARRVNGLYVTDPFGTAASDYREAHPERKPWHDAIPGQAWVVEWQTEDEAFEDVLLVAEFSVEGRVFADAEEMVTLSIMSATITSARRIWPEDAS